MSIVTGSPLATDPGGQIPDVCHFQKNFKTRNYSWWASGHVTSLLSQWSWVRSPLETYALTSYTVNIYIRNSYILPTRCNLTRGRVDPRIVTTWGRANASQRVNRGDSPQQLPTRSILNITNCYILGVPCNLTRGRVDATYQTRSETRTRTHTYTHRTSYATKIFLYGKILLNGRQGWTPWSWDYNALKVKFQKIANPAKIASIFP